VPSIARFNLKSEKRQLQQNLSYFEKRHIVHGYFPAALKPSVASLWCRWFEIAVCERV
jgi:hypothetical protein